MSQLSAHGEKIAQEVAERHGVSTDAAVVLLRALAEGRGNQAQFNHPDLGGMGQWSRGGMIMVGDMFNNALKARVDALCTELSGYLLSDDVFAPTSTTATQSQSQSGGAPGASLFVSGNRASGNWWPANLGSPSSTGAQNNLRYAFFPATRRLAIDIGGRVTVYDTGDHQIGGFSQQQSGDQSLTFTSQHGLVRVHDLPIVEGATATATAQHATVSEEPPRAVTSTGDETPRKAPAQSAQPEDVLATIERLAALREKGILSQAEFDAKKSELLSRL